MDHYLSLEQLAYFKSRLLSWKTSLLKDSNAVKTTLAEKNVEPDMFDSAATIINQTTELRTKDRARKLIHKIDLALEKIENGTYGYCEETDNPIGYNRLDARPIATLCIEAQEIHEKKERTYRKSRAIDDE